MNMKEDMIKGGTSSHGHITIVDNTAKQIRRAKKRAKKEDRPKFKVIG